MFNMQERMLAVVTRWSGLPRLHNQSVAEHSYYVALYTDQLCRRFNWSPEYCYEAVSYALIHDMAEATTGDIMGPVKRKVVNAVTLSDYEKEIMKELGPFYSDRKPPTAAIKVVVKAANIIDEFFHISLELAMGNNCMKAMQAAVMLRMSTVLENMGMKELLPEIAEEGRKMMEGIAFVQENSDIALP